MKKTNAYSAVIVSVKDKESKVTYYYDMTGMLQVVELDMDTSDTHLFRFFATHMPIYDDFIEKMVINAKSKFNTILHVYRVPLDLSFDNFWNIYDYKYGRIKAEAEWKKTSDVEKALVFKALPKYNFYLQTHKNQDKVWANRYLKEKRYMDG